MPHFATKFSESLLTQTAALSGGRETGLQMTTENRSDDVAERQAIKYSAAVGKGVPKEVVDSVREQLKMAGPPPIYDDHKEVPFVYEVIENEGWRQRALSVIVPWVANPANVARAGVCVKRTVPQTDPEELRCGFCVFRLKERVDKEGSSVFWKSMQQDGLGIHPGHAETVVFIALEDLGPSNGFFMPLKYGQDVCVDSKADVLFPSTGGGKGLCFVLKI